MINKKKNQLYPVILNSLIRKVFRTFSKGIGRKGEQKNVLIDIIGFLLCGTARSCANYITYV